MTDPSVEVIASYQDGDLAGRPAITRLATSAGTASYISPDLDETGRMQEINRVAAAAGVQSELAAELRGLVELMVRTDGTSETAFLRNRSPRPVDIASFGSAHTVVGRDADGTNSVLPSPGVAVAVSRGGNEAG